MKIACLKEIKKHEYRVGMSPNCVASYTAHGHQVSLEAGAGEGSGFSDEEYKAAGATIIKNRQELCENADMIIKVKEIQPEEYSLLHEGQILYTYFHLAPDPQQTKALLEAKIKGVAYETLKAPDGSLPCLKPMSEIAGRLSIQEGAKYLEKPFGGSGILLGGVPGVARGKICILGGGVVGLNAAKRALGIGAEVIILDINPQRLAYLDDVFQGQVSTLYSNRGNILEALSQADLLIGGVLIPGARAPHLVKSEDLSLMKKGSVLVDVAVDQGGCIESTRATSHDDPVYEYKGVIHYCVANMPGAVARTSTLALINTTLGYGLEIADKGLEKALRENPAIRAGLNVYEGKCTYPDVAKALNLAYFPADQVC